MRFGLGRLRLAPAHFWSMTPRELAAAASAYAPVTATPLDRRGFAALAAVFPIGRGPPSQETSHDRDTAPDENAEAFLRLDRAAKQAGASIAAALAAGQSEGRKLDDVLKKVGQSLAATAIQSTAKGLLGTLAASLGSDVRERRRFGRGFRWARRAAGARRPRSGGERRAGAPDVGRVGGDGIGEPRRAGLGHHPDARCRELPPLRGAGDGRHRARRPARPARLVTGERAMQAFHEVRFPIEIGFRSRGGPERRTDVVLLGSGREERNARWAHARRRYDAGYGVRSLRRWAQVLAFFEERRGRLHGFRFRTGWIAPLPSAARRRRRPTSSSARATGRRAAFPLCKTYGASFAPYVRAIAKPVAGSVSVAVAGSERKEGEHYDLDATTGLVTFRPDAVPCRARR